MTNRTEKLDREAMLMLHAAGELPVEQKQRVDQMLAADASLQGELSDLLEAQRMVQRELAEADLIDPMPISAASASRAAVRQIRQRLTEELGRPAKTAAGIGKRWLGILYPASVAAAVLAFGIYKWSRVQDSYPAPNANNLAMDGFPEDNSDARRLVAGVFPDIERPASDLDNVEAQINSLVEWTQSTQ